MSYLPTNWPSRLFPPARISKMKCIGCKQPFSSENIFTDAGWREAAISQTCEICFDKMFEEEE